jgi:uncharacterized protein (TIGR02265 family)
LQQIKGAVLKSRLAYVEEQFGAEGLARVTAALTPDDQAALRMVITAKWYPFEVGRRLDEVIVRVLGGGDQAVFERLGAASAQRNLTTVHQAFLAPGDPHAFLAKARQIYALYYETGRREYEKTGDREGVLTTYDAETFSAPDCLTVIGWYRRALEMCGAREVRILHEECRAKGDAVCRYRVSWG